MHRKSRGRNGSGILNLDSLMDILSCLVGVMLFLVIYTVLELGSATYEADVPIVRDPPPGSDPVWVLAERGTVRILDVEGALDRLLSGIEIVQVPDVPVFVRQANERAPVHDHFAYTLSYQQRLAALDDPLAVLDLEIVEREGAVGDSLHRMGPTSTFARVLSGLDPAESWLAFTVDSASVDVFRRARDMANARGFASRWALTRLEFPMTLSLGEGPVETLVSATSEQAKPQR